MGGSAGFDTPQTQVEYLCRCEGARFVPRPNLIPSAAAAGPAAGVALHAGAVADQHVVAANR